MQPHTTSQLCQPHPLSPLLVCNKPPASSLSPPFSGAIFLAVIAFRSRRQHLHRYPLYSTPPTTTAFTASSSSPLLTTKHNGPPSLLPRHHRHRNSHLISFSLPLTANCSRCSRYYSPQQQCRLRHCTSLPSPSPPSHHPCRPLSATSRQQRPPHILVVIGEPPLTANHNSEPPLPSPSDSRKGDAENLYKRLTRLKSRSYNSPNSGRDGFLGLFGKNKDLVDHYTKRLEDLEENVRQQQSRFSTTVEEVSAAFVCFKSRYGASIALHIQQSVNPTEWVTEQAPEPHDVYWPLFSSSFIRRWISKLLVIVASITLTVLYLLPVAFVQGLTNLDQLETLLPSLKNILEISVVSQVITGYLPSLILQLFFSIVPPIMKTFSTMQGNISFSGIEKSACSKMLWFTMWNAFFANVLTGSVTSQLQIFFEPKDIPWRLAVGVPTQASFYIAYVVTSWTSLSTELTRVIALLGDWIGGCSGCLDDELQVPSMTYHSEIPRILLFLLLGLIYFLLSPLILPFILVYFCIGYIIYRNQLLNVYLPKYETGGQFWPIVHNSTIFSLILMQAMAFGIFSLKKLPLASSLLLPLPVVTLLFHGYCRKRFQPIFQDFSAETLIKKDRSDQNDPGMNEFFDKLKTAYNDPSLVPKDRSQYADDRNTPLLSSVES